MTRPTATPSDAKPALTPKLRFPEFRNAPEWESKELHTIAEPVSERADNEDENNILTLSGEHGLVLQSEYFGKQIAGTNSERYLKIERDDFVYNDRTTKASEYGTIKRLTKHPHGIVSPIYKCFRFKAGELPVFWEWYFESGAHEAELRSLANEGARAGRFNVSIDRFLSTSVYTPKRGSAEQQKIAECLSTLDELIGAESQKLDALKAHKKGLMQQLFPREGETLPRLRFPEFHSAPEWEVKSLESLARRGSGHTPSKAHSEYYNGGIKWVSLADSRRLDNGLISETEIEISELGIENSSACLHPAGSVLISRDAGVGKSAVMASAMAVSQHFIVWTCDSGKITNWFLYHLLQKMKPLFERVATGSTIKTIGLPFFKDLRVTIPKPAEQHRIATCLSSLDDLIAAQSDRLAALQTHKQGLLQQLFPSPAVADA